MRILILSNRNKIVVATFVAIPDLMALTHNIAKSHLPEVNISQRSCSSELFLSVFKQYIDKKYQNEKILMIGYYLSFTVIKLIRFLHQLMF